MTHSNAPADQRTVVLIAFLGALNALGPISNDLFVPSLPLAADGLGVSQGDIQLTMSAVLVGFAVGQLIYGPLSDRYGRRPLLCLGLALYVFASYLCARSIDLQDLILGRSLQGLGGAAGMVLARAIILDRWVGTEASRVLSWVAVISFSAPVCAPLVGGYLALLGYWPMVFWLQAALGGLCFIGALTLLSKVRGGNPDVSIAASFAGYLDVIRDREALLYMACLGFGHAGVMAFVTNSAFVFVRHLGLEAYQYGYCFSAVMVGGVTGAFLNGRLVRGLGIGKLMSFGTIVVASSGVGALLASLSLSGLWAILVPSLCYMFGMAFIFSNVIARVLSRFREKAGAAAALVGVSQFLAGAVSATVLSLNDTPSSVPLASALAMGGVASAGLWWGWLRHRPVTPE